MIPITEDTTPETVEEPTTNIYAVGSSGPGTLPETETTTRVTTTTSGTIHGTRIGALRIIAGSEFPVDDTAFIRFSPGVKADETKFNVGIDASSLDVNPPEFDDAVITGTNTLVTPPYGPETEVSNRVEFQTPYGSRSIFQTLKDEHDDCYHAQYHNKFTPRWNIIEQHLDFVIGSLLDTGYNVAVQLGTLRELYDPHPDYNISEHGQHLITDEALIDPDYYETETPKPETGHGKGGNPHDVEYFLENGECPVPDCDAEFELFRGLKCHVAGKSQRDDDDGEQHQTLNLRRHEVTISTEQSPDTDQSQ